MTFDDPLLKLLLSTLLGAIVGWERFVDNKPAGLRTHTLVCLGATRFHGLGRACAGRDPHAGRGRDPRHAGRDHGDRIPGGGLDHPVRG